MIQRFSFDVGQMTCGREGEYVRVSDHLERVRVLREALEALLDAATVSKIPFPAVLARARKAYEETDDGN